jgi:hypothetical protein
MITRQQAETHVTAQADAGLLSSAELQHCLSRIAEIATGHVYGHSIGWREQQRKYSVIAGI